MMKTEVVITVEIEPAIDLHGHPIAATCRAVENFVYDRLAL